MVLGLLAGLARTNCWTIAEHAGQASPYALQHLLSRAVWDHDGVHEDLRGYVVEHLGCDDAVLVVDETGDLKKGTGTVGVQRQYTGTAGRIENAQVGVMLTYATGRGHAFLDRSLYLPQSWTDDPGRCAAAGIPAETSFQTKPQLAGEMIARALDAGTRPAGWPLTRCTATTRSRVNCCVSAASVTCWPSPATTGSAPTPGHAGRSTWRSACPHRCGRPEAPGPDRRDTAGMSGPWSTSTNPTGPVSIGC
jgi:hypothetical protein